jgi:mono/diheme cytochrome c family protein
MGFDNNFPSFEASKGFTGSGLPLQIWGRFMKDVKRYRPAWGNQFNEKQINDLIAYIRSIAVPPYKAPEK